MIRWRMEEKQKLASLNRNLYGQDVSGVLPKPITVNVIASDTRKFHFAIFQLNTLDLNGSDGIKNIYWHQPELEQLYEFCGYEKAIPVLKGYNPEAFDKLMTMYTQETSIYAKL